MHFPALNHNSLKVPGHIGTMNLDPGTLSARYIAIQLGSSIFLAHQQLLIVLFIIALIISNIVVWVYSLVTVIKPHALLTRQELLLSFITCCRQ